MDNKNYDDIQRALRNALLAAMRPYKNRPLTPQRREAMKKEAMDIIERIIPVKMDPEHLEKFIDGILDQGIQVKIK